MTYDSKFDHWPTAPQATWPAKNAKVITPSNTLDITDAAGDAFPMYTKGLYIGGAGNITVIMAGNKADDTTTVLFTGLLVGLVYPFQIRRILVTGTSATLIVGLFD